MSGQTIQSRRMSGDRNGWPAGYTLLELLLSLALTVIVFAGIATAITVFYQALVSQQRQIEQDLLARNLMAMISNDLRAGLQYKAADVAGIENLAVSEALMGGLAGGGGAATGGGSGGTDDGGGSGTGQGSGGQGTGGQGSGGQGTGGASGMGGSGEESEEPDPATVDNAWYRPSFIGNSSQFTLDVSRLPRPDQYNALTTDLSATSTPSDIKRVAWMVALQPGNAQGRDSLDPVGESMGGLYRREVDRAVSAYREEPDMPPGPDEYSRLMATEVVGLQFRYFDGDKWQDQWESGAVGGYPLAVEVTLLLDPDRTSDNPAASGNRQTGSGNQHLRSWRGVVHLPVAEIIPAEDGSSGGSSP